VPSLHSHGGNLAVHAVWRLLDADHGPIPVVTLATPFLFASHKKVYPALLWAGGLMAFLVLVGAGALAWSWAEGGLDPGARWLAVLLIAFSMVVVVQLWAFVHWLAHHGRVWRIHVQTRFLEDVQAPGPGDLLRAGGHRADPRSGPAQSAEATPPGRG
jgi:hypothetical protein